MINIEIIYFAILKERRGQSREILTTELTTPLEIYNSLAKKYAFGLDIDLVRCAINNEYAPLNQKLEGGESLVFIPPVAGG